MLQEGFKRLKSLILGSAAALLIAASPAVQAAEKKEAAQTQKQAPAIEMVWNDFHSVVGKCTMKFPGQPEHVTESMAVPEEGYDLRYDAYISAVDKKMVYMLLIAQYPDFVDESYAQMSLESFLNGILTHNPGNQLIFADLLLVDGHEALDFFIRTGSVYFKGRALMVKNSLYLMAMECDIQCYDEKGYNQFVTSFKLVNN